MKGEWRGSPGKKVCEDETLSGRASRNRKQNLCQGHARNVSTDNHLLSFQARLLSTVSSEGFHWLQPVMILP